MMGNLAWLQEVNDVVVIPKLGIPGMATVSFGGNVSWLARVMVLLCGSAGNRSR